MAEIDEGFRQFLRSIFYDDNGHCAGCGECVMDAGSGIPDAWTLHPPGSVLIVGGRRWRVTDRGHDIRGRRLDLFLSTCAEARLYGRRVVSVREVAE